MKPPEALSVCLSNTMQVDGRDDWNTCSRHGFFRSFHVSSQVESTLFIYHNNTNPKFASRDSVQHMARSIFRSLDLYEEKNPPENVPDLHEDVK